MKNFVNIGIVMKFSKALHVSLASANRGNTIGYMESPIGRLRITIADGAVTEITNHLGCKEGWEDGCGGGWGESRADGCGGGRGKSREYACNESQVDGCNESQIDGCDGSRADGRDLAVLKEATMQLTEYFQGRRRQFTFPMAPTGTEFQQQVWKALQQIPYGQTLSYGQVAEGIGNGKASRAAGNAIGANPILVAIPCHRVIRNDGGIGGFSAGLENKKRLHRIEGISDEKV
jgi:O-6-methylguanine DNA methyltransferase